jgi:hypothetical protein
MMIDHHCLRSHIVEISLWPEDTDPVAYFCSTHVTWCGPGGVITTMHRFKLCSGSWTIEENLQCYNCGLTIGSRDVK